MKVKVNRKNIRKKPFKIRDIYRYVHFQTNGKLLLKDPHPKSVKVSNIQSTPSRQLYVQN